MIKIIATNVACQAVPLGKYTFELETRGLIFPTTMIYIADRVIGYRKIEDFLSEWTDIKFLGKVDQEAEFGAIAGAL